MTNTYDALALFSGGLDSILACKTIQDQGMTVLGLHFTTPFFGNPDKIPFWREQYGVEVTDVDISAAYVRLLTKGPRFGFGKQLNPCVDCKVTMLSFAKALMADYGAKVLITGEVVGQRPMSQRRDSLNLIKKHADVSDVLVRPLCARNIDPTPVEEAGIVDRGQLRAIGGRGRKEQLRLAREVYGFTEIPTPAGGCSLTEAENAHRYLAVLQAYAQIGKAALAGDFVLAGLGRQFWRGVGGSEPRWLTIGRDQKDNERMRGLVRDTDLVFDVDSFPSPLGLGRQLHARPWDGADVRDAAAFMASYAPKAVKSGEEVDVLVTEGGETTRVTVLPSRGITPPWAEPDGTGLREFKLPFTP